MAKIFLSSSLSILLIFLLSRATAAAAARPISDPNPQESTSLQKPSRWDSSIHEDDCEGLDTNECTVRRMAIAHTDYIYTQDIKGR